MRRHLFHISLGALLISLVVPAGNALATPRPTKGTRGYIVVPPAPVGVVPSAAADGDQPAGFSRILYLNDCKPNGCEVTVGYDDSSTDTSSIIDGPIQLSAFDRDNWDDVVACVTDLFAPYDILVTDEDPGATVHMEEMVGGVGAEFGGASWEGTLGVAPFAGDCSYIPHSIAYTFAGESYYDTNSTNELCATIGQEIAHTWGLDHETLASDPMTYLDYAGMRTFKDEDVACGEYEDRTCACGDATQNSHVGIMALFGPAPDDAGADSGGCCESSNRSAAPMATLLVGVVALGLGRRRRRR